MNWLREPETEPIPGYRLVGPLGTGGFGEVWKCVAPGGVPKAIKFVYGNLNALDGDAVKAQQEKAAIERMITIRHPFVLSTERIDVVDGELLIVMPLADKSLHDLFGEYQQAGRPGVPRELLLGMLADAAEGLDHLIEKHNLQHLDVKPKNLFLIADRVAVADFGLVKTLERTNTSGMMGGITPVYAAPETFANKISKHSDQYSLAVVYVELLTGRRPFSGKNLRQLAIQHMTEPPDLSGLPEADQAAVARALAKEPEDRFPSNVAFIRALGGGGLRSEVTTAAAGSSGVETPSPNRKKPATTPEMDLGATQPGANKTPRPIGIHDLLRGDTADPHRVSMTVSFRPEEGVLRPAVLIGVGSFGRRALQQIRCRLLDRIGALTQVPCWRFLLVDSEPNSGRKPSGGPSDAAVLPEHVFHAPLQPVTAYRRRQLDQLLEWLPREKLYGIPRSLRVDSSRSLGRLALCDHYLKFTQRLRREVQEAIHPQALTDSADHTGLPTRSKQPSVYVFASATGGTGGMLMDVGHAVRRALDKFGLTESAVTAFLFAGAPEDPNAPAVEQANVFAALTELNHYADPDVTFTAQYAGSDGPLVEANGLPFTATYLLPMAERTAEAFLDCVSHLAGYVAHDLTTPFGTGLEKLRKRTPPAGRTPFRGFGTFGVWFPRGLLLRSAARQQCVKLLRDWSAAPVAGQLLPAAEAVLHRIASDPRLTPDQVQAFVSAQAGGADGDPAAKLAAFVAGLADQVPAASRRPDSQGWANSVWDHVRDTVGLDPTSEADSSFRRGRLSRALDGGVKKALEAWQNELTELLRPLNELSGARLAAQETTLTALMASAAQAADALDGRVRQLVEPRAKAKAEVTAALLALDALDQQASFTWFGNRVAKQLRAVTDKVKAFAEVRLSEDQAGAGVLFYRRLHGWLDDRRRDVRAARERVAQLAATLAGHESVPGDASGTGTTVAEQDDDSIGGGLRGSNTMRVVLPRGEDNLDRAALTLLDRLPAGEAERLEQILTRLVVEPRGGLVNACRGAADPFRLIASPMIEQATAFLKGLLPTEDVTEVELSAAGERSGELARRVASYSRMAAPLAGGPAEEERTFVMVPEGDSGERYASEVRAALPGSTTVPVRGLGADLLFCREQGCLRPNDLAHLLEPCWEAYEQAANSIDSNPHSRFDVTAWLPLVE